jgi:tetrahydromethanopterin S-methyltransferase subunit E
LPVKARLVVTVTVVWVLIAEFRPRAMAYAVFGEFALGVHSPFAMKKNINAGASTRIFSQVIHLVL